MIEAHHICGLSSDQLFECLSPTPDCEPLKGRVVVPPLPRFPKCPAWHQAPGVFGLLALPLEAGGPPQGGQQARGSLEEGPRQTLFLLSLLSVSGILGRLSLLHASLGIVHLRGQIGDERVWLQ